MSEDSHQVKRARKSNDVPAVMRIDLAKATSLLNKRKANAVLETNGQDDAALQCLLDFGMRQNGYPSVSWSHTEANIQVSHLALRVDKGDTAVPTAASERLQVISATTSFASKQSTSSRKQLAQTAVETAV